MSAKEERIDHVAEALRMAEKANQYLRALDGKPSSDAQAVVSQLAAVNGNLNALVHAQIASVEQQRIANIVALISSAARGVAEGTHSRDDYLRLYGRLNPLVMSALGIGGDDA